MGSGFTFLISTEMVLVIRPFQRNLSEEEGGRRPVYRSSRLARRVGGSLYSSPLCFCPPTRRANRLDRKSTRLNSSHPSISYAVFCLKKKTTKNFTSCCRDAIIFAVI